MLNNVSFYGNFIYYITILLLLYNVYTKSTDFVYIFDSKYKFFNLKVIRLTFSFIFFIFICYFLYDTSIWYFNYNEYIHNPYNKFIKISLGLILLCLKLIINKIKNNEIELISLFKFLFFILCPLFLPIFIEYIMHLNIDLHSILRPIILNCVQFFAFLSLFFVLVPTLYQSNFWSLNSLILGYKDNFPMIGNINKFKWQVNAVDNVGSSNKISSDIGTGQQVGSGSDTPDGEKEEKGESRGKSIFKRPTLIGVEYDSDTDSERNAATSRLRQRNREAWRRLHNMYDNHISYNPNFPTDEYYESSGDIMMKYIDYRNKKLDGKITIREVNDLINSKGWNAFPFDKLHKLSDDIDFELCENRKNIKWTKDDLLELIIERNQTSNLEEKEELETELKKYKDEIKRLKNTELSLRAEQLALNFRKAGITPTDIYPLRETKNE